MYLTEKSEPEWKNLPLVTWLMQENGALSENTKGDGGKSLGLCQCHSYWRRNHTYIDDNGKEQKGCAQTYLEQRRQCIDWFIWYTRDSTPETIYRDIRIGHNSAHGTYQYEMKRKESKFTQ